jgi:hypothetical protein
MQRVKRSTAVAVLPAAPAGGTPGFFASPNPGGGVPATIPGFEWYNGVQEELMAVIEGQGLSGSDSDHTKLRQAIAKMIQAGQRAVVINSATFAGAVTGIGKAVYWDSANSRFDLALADGTVKQNCVGFADVPNGNLYAFGDAVLFSGKTPGARYYLDAATAGAITTVAPANAVAVGIARSATELFIDVDPASGLSQAQADARYLNIGYMLVQDQKASGTAAGGASVGVQQRTLNTVASNTISGASLSSNQITLPAGTYRVRGYSMSATGVLAQTWLSNVTDGVIAALGQSGAGFNQAQFPNMPTEFVGRFTIAAPKVFDIQHYSSAAIGTNGLGRPASSGNVEIYTSLEIIKES